MITLLSPREREICLAASVGLTNKEIAGFLKIQQCTVDSYWRRIFAKTGALGRTHAVALWLQWVVAPIGAAVAARSAGFSLSQHQGNAAVAA